MYATSNEEKYKNICKYDIRSRELSVKMLGIFFLKVLGEVTVTKAGCFMRTIKDW